MSGSQLAVDDIDKSRLEARTTNEEPVDVWLLAELAAVLFVDTTAVEDSSLLGNAVTDFLLQPSANGGMYLLGLLSGSDLSSSNGPDRLIGNDYLRPVRDLSLEGSELGAHVINGLSCLALLERLSTTPDNANTVFSGVLGL